MENREILFRGKRLFSFENEDVFVHGYYVVRNKYHFIYCQNEKGTWRYIQVDPKSISQYTGMNDRLTREKVFENDLIKVQGNRDISNGTFKVIYFDGGFYAYNLLFNDPITAVKWSLYYILERGNLIKSEDETNL